jgi:hypothetical protein
VNMANCYEHLDRPLEALHHFERFLADAENATRQQRREVQTAIARLRAQLGELRLSVAPDGATVTIDSAETRRAPILEPILLTAGTHALEVRMDGFRTHRRDFEVIGGQVQRLTIGLERGEDPPPVVAVPPEPEPVVPVAVEPVIAPEPVDEDTSSFTFRLTPPVIIGLVSTGALTAAAVVSGSIALAANGDFENAVTRSNDASLSPAERNQARADGISAANTANTASVLTDIFMIGAIAAAGVSVFFIVLDGLSGEETDETADNGPRVMAAPFATDRSGGFSLLGSF